MPPENDTSDAFALRAVDLTKTYRSGSSDLVVFAGLNLEIARPGKRSPWWVNRAPGKARCYIFWAVSTGSATNGAIYFGQNDIW